MMLSRMRPVILVAIEVLNATVVFMATIIHALVIMGLASLIKQQALPLDVVSLAAGVGAGLIVAMNGLPRPVHWLIRRIGERVCR